MEAFRIPIAVLVKPVIATVTPAAALVGSAATPSRLRESDSIRTMCWHSLFRARGSLSDNVGQSGESDGRRSCFRIQFSNCGHHRGCRSAHRRRLGATAFFHRRPAGHFERIAEPNRCRRPGFSIDDHRFRFHIGLGSESGPQRTRHNVCQRHSASRCDYAGTPPDLRHVERHRHGARRHQLLSSRASHLSGACIHQPAICARWKLLHYHYRSRHRFYASKRHCLDECGANVPAQHQLRKLDDTYSHHSINFSKRSGNCVHSGAEYRGPRHVGRRPFAIRGATGITSVRPTRWTQPAPVS